MGRLWIVGKGTHSEISQVDGCPGDVLGHSGNNVNNNFPCRNKHDMDHPCAYRKYQKGPS